MRRPKQRTGNRTDLPLPATGAASQPVQTATGLPYGEAGQLRSAQNAIPLARQAPPAGPGGPGTPPGATPAGVDFASALQAARNMVPPDQVLSRPTERPGEHLLTGMNPLGTMPAAPAQQNLGGFLSSLASSPTATAEVQTLAGLVAGGRQ